MYRENIRLLENEVSRYNEPMSAQAEQIPAYPAAMTSIQKMQVIDKQPFTSQVVPSVYSFPLSKDTIAELQIRGEITKEKLAMLRDHIELTIRALSAEVPPSDKNS